MRRLSGVGTQHPRWRHTHMNRNSAKCRKKSQRKKIIGNEREWHGITDKYVGCVLSGTIEPLPAILNVSDSTSRFFLFSTMCVFTEFIFIWWAGKCNASCMSTNMGTNEEKNVRTTEVLKRLKLFLCASKRWDAHDDDDDYRSTALFVIWSGRTQTEKCAWQCDSFE